MGHCRLCRTTSNQIAKALGVCLQCIHTQPSDSLEIIRTAHAHSRDPFDLSLDPPRHPNGIACKLCVNNCVIGEGQIGYCGVRNNVKGRLQGVSSTQGKVSWYHDPLPTNCVADWVCPAGTGSGYPEFANCQGPERGHTNLAVFFHACSFNCLFCQNWHFKRETFDSQMTSADQLVDDINRKTACICYFGGDPSSQLPFSLKVSTLARQRYAHRPLRICWETNGSMNPRLLTRMIDVALESGGCIKFDLKAFDEALHIALTGITNKQTLANFKQVAAAIKQRSEPPLLLASTLLVPGYIDEKEVEQIAGMIASLDSDIPYSLLAFHPQFYMADMPLTSKESALRCQQVAHNQGLKRVRIGNQHLLF